MEKYNQFGPVVNISEYYSRANNMDMEQRREAFKLAFEWIRNIPLCDCDIDLATAYAEGVIYGWNNPNWIPVENKLPPENGKTSPNVPTALPCYAPNGICTNPQMDCINCPKRGTGGTWSTNISIKAEDAPLQERLNNNKED